MTKKKHVSAFFTFNSNVSQFLTDAQAFYTAISTAPGSSYVTVTPASITAAQAHITTARTAETAVSTGSIGLASARNLAVAVVETDVRNFMLIVQGAANNAPDLATATTIITECGLTTRRVTSKVKLPFDVLNDDTTAGLLDIIYKAVPHSMSVCYETQISTDNLSWTTVKVTPDSRITYMHGVASGTKLYFRGRVILGEKKGGAQAWVTPPAPYLITL